MAWQRYPVIDLDGLVETLFVDYRLNDIDQFTNTATVLKAGTANGRIHIWYEHRDGDLAIAFENEGDRDQFYANVKDWYSFSGYEIVGNRYAARK